MKNGEPVMHLLLFEREPGDILTVQGAFAIPVSTDSDPLLGVVDVGSGHVRPDIARFKTEDEKKDDDEGLSDERLGGGAGAGALHEGLAFAGRGHGMVTGRHGAVVVAGGSSHAGVRESGAVA